MLIIEPKPYNEILKLTGNRTVIMSCEGCRDVYFSEKAAIAMREKLLVCGTDLVVISSDYVCTPEHFELYILKYTEVIESADTILVFSCGVGVQVIAERLNNKRVYAACDTYPLPGYQGVTPLEFDCELCGECRLNETGAICPITACSKGLINGQCGGAKNGMCEVDKDMECGWERIHRRLEKLGQLPTACGSIQVRNFAPEANSKGG